MQVTHGVVGHWRGDWDELALQRWAESLRARLTAPEVSLGLIFISPKYFEVAAEILEIVRLYARIPVLIGCSGSSLVANGSEIEDDARLVLGLFHLPGAELRSFQFDSEALEGVAKASDWTQRTRLEAAAVHGWLTFASPGGFNGENWLRSWNAAYPGIPAQGGLAAGAPGDERVQLYLNGDVFEEGVVALGIGGAVGLETVVSQGCTPIGDTWTITRSDRNLIVQIANRPAFSVLADTFNALPAEEQAKAQNNLFIGLASDEYLDEFHRGDFLIRNLLGGDPEKGVLAVGAYPRPGQTIQFQRRDGPSATEDLTWTLNRARRRLAGREVYGGCLCICNGRGARLFGRPDHDAGLIQEQLGPLALAGFFGNGELGPVGRRNFLHGYTATLGLFVKRD
jgi:small ligand-binding sensory domain FIST